jgi:hypothetical protein
MLRGVPDWRAISPAFSDATLIETHKRDALPCYKGFKAYQPLNCWWAVCESPSRPAGRPLPELALRLLDRQPESFTTEDAPTVARERPVALDPR